MRRRDVALVGLVAVTAGAACAQILGYDSVAPREEDAGVGAEAGLDAPATHVDAPIETLAETAVDGEDTGPAPVRVPERTTSDPTPSGKGKRVWFLARKYHLGNELPSGAHSPDAWRTLGYDLDHVCTGPSESKENVGTCRRVDGANQDVLIDGDGCRDNNFGAHVIALIAVTNPNFEDTTNTGLTKGANTWVFVIDDLDDGPDDAYAPGILYHAAAIDGTWTPAYDGTDVRTASSDSVVGNDLTKPLTTFPKGFVRGNVWVSGLDETVSLSLPVGSFAVGLPLVGASITIKLSDDHKTALDGIVAGAIPWAGFESVLRPVADSSGVCPGSSLYTSLLKTVSKFPDVSVGSPTLQDLGMTCDGISFGIGFDLAPVRPITAVTPAPPSPPSRCDAGAGG